MEEIEVEGVCPYCGTAFKTTAFVQEKRVEPTVIDEYTLIRKSFPQPPYTFCVNPSCKKMLFVELLPAIESPPTPPN